ncbi:tyrosine-type recombinase/integrase [Vibrio aestuarianus]|uniref:Site-specific integrase n=1 Tax=Vibrio aestuarianus TaxID=28171 RepID=A0ABD7YR28_9VIBR|nr:site-specific integrase [Vibrio aestuarianus]WGK87219.1 site-specific integrase [Vibrio aestuarianus]CAH8235642.1 putative Integrase [Vibrio aestuarianus]
MAITDTWLRSIYGKPYSGKAEITYRDGVGVRISPKGKITWIYRVNFFGKPIKLKLGEYPAMKIRDALRERDSKAELVTHGLDPRKVLTIETGVKPTTLDDVIDYWVEHHAKENVKRWQALKKMFDTDVSPYLGGYPVKQLELSDFMPTFHKAKHRVGPKHSANLMSRLKQVLSYAVRHGLIKNNVISELKKRDVGQPTEVKRSRQSEDNVPALWRAISDLTIHESNKNFLRLMVIFANRSNELRLARKSDFDLDRLVWTVPQEHNKTRKKDGREIRRAIPSLAVEVIKQQFDIWPEYTIMFPPVVVKEDRPMAANIPVDFGAKLANKIEELGYPRTTNHDMRRTARNIWESQGTPYHVGETMLGHKVHTGVQSHYLDYDYLDEQRIAYENWCSVLRGGKKGS